MYYIYDFTGEGYTEISGVNLHNENALVGKAETYNEAEEIASEYEASYSDSEEDDEFDAEEDLMEQKKDYYNNNATLTF